MDTIPTCLTPHLLKRQLKALPNGATIVFADTLVTRLGDLFEVGSWGRLDRLFTIEETISLLTEEGQTDEQVEGIGRGEGPSG